MAAGEGVCPFPLPPSQYYTLFTDENIAKDNVPKPPPPIEGSYTMFGATFETDDSIIQPLETQGITRLYPQNRRIDRITELKKLNHSIVINFLELLDILIKSPSSSMRDEKLEDIRLLFINMHHLINELRPHQARETLRVMMGKQKRQRFETADKLQKNINRVVAILQTSMSHMNLSQDDETNQQITPMDQDVDASTVTAVEENRNKREDHINSILEALH